MYNGKRTIVDKDTCVDCEFATKRPYFSRGSLSSLEYHCTLQNGKHIFTTDHYISPKEDHDFVPVCPLALFEEGES